MDVLSDKLGGVCMGFTVEATLFSHPFYIRLSM